MCLDKTNLMCFSFWEAPARGRAHSAATLDLDISASAFGPSATAEDSNGALINKYIENGEIVPVEITVKLLLQAMKKSPSNNFLIDGFPRNADNLQGWYKTVGEKARVHGSSSSTARRRYGVAPHQTW